MFKIYTLSFLVAIMLMASCSRSVIVTSSANNSKKSLKNSDLLDDDNDFNYYFKTYSLQRAGMDYMIIDSKCSSPFQVVNLTLDSLNVENLKKQNQSK